MKEISVMWWNVKLIHMWRNFRLGGQRLFEQCSKKMRIWWRRAPLTPLCILKLLICQCGGRQPEAGTACPQDFQNTQNKNAGLTQCRWPFSSQHYNTEGDCGICSIFLATLGQFWKCRLPVKLPRNKTQNTDLWAAEIFTGLKIHPKMW